VRAGVTPCCADLQAPEDFPEGDPPCAGVVTYTLHASRPVRPAFGRVSRRLRAGRYRCWPTTATAATKAFYPVLTRKGLRNSSAVGCPARKRPNLTGFPPLPARVLLRASARPASKSARRRLAARRRGA
jgi:hypothetical protein